MTKKFYTFGTGYLNEKDDGEQYIAGLTNKKTSRFEGKNGVYENVVLQAVDSEGNVIPIDRFFVNFKENGGETSQNGKKIPDVTFSFTNNPKN